MWYRNSFWKGGLRPCCAAAEAEAGAEVEVEEDAGMEAPVAGPELLPPVLAVAW